MRRKEDIRVESSTMIVLKQSEGQTKTKADKI